MGLIVFRFCVVWESDWEGVDEIYSLRGGRLGWATLNGRDILT